MGVTSFANAQVVEPFGGGKEQMKHLSKLCAAAFVAAYATSAHAADDEIIVEGLRLPTPIGETGSSVSVITAEDIELRAYQFALDAIATAPGVTVNQNGAIGGLASVRIRGASADQTLVLLDGVPFGDPTSVGGGYDFSILDPADIERIEILKGPHSTLWGSDAIGGVVNIITKRASEGFGGRAFLEGGSFATVRGGGAVYGGGPGGDFRLSASGLTSNGISKAEEDDDNPERDGYDSYTVDGGGGVNVGKVRLEAKARYQTGETQIDGFPPPVFSLSDTDDKSSTDQLSLHGRAIAPLFNDRLNNEFSIGFTDITRNGSFGGFATKDEGDRLILRYQGTAQLFDKHRIAVGAEREETEANGEETSINAAFALLEVKPIEGLTVSAGLRYDDHSTFGDEVTARAAAALTIAKGVILRGSWGEGFKAPTIFQLTQSFGALPPNADLQPETSEAFDVGLDLDVFDGRTRFGVTYFNRDTENLIIFAPNFRYENLAQTEAQGIEIAAEFSLSERIALNTGYAYIDAKDAVTGERQIRTPRHSGDAALSYRDERLSGAVSIRYNGEETEGPFGSDVDAWTRVDLSAAYAVSETIELYGRIENLLDADYQQVSGFGTPGLSGYAGVRLTF